MLDWRLPWWLIALIVGAGVIATMLGDPSNKLPESHPRTRIATVLAVVSGGALLLICVIGAVQWLLHG